MIRSQSLPFTASLTVFTSRSCIAPSHVPLTEHFVKHDQISSDKITQTGGASGASADSLESVSWYDASGRVVTSRGGSVSKTNYDRLGGVDRAWTLSQVGWNGLHEQLRCRDMLSLARRI